MRSEVFMEKFLWNDPEIEQLLLNDAEKETLEKFIGADAELPDMLNARERRVWMQETASLRISRRSRLLHLKYSGAGQGPAACSGGICLCTFGDRFRVGYRKYPGLKAQPNPR